MGIGQRSVNSAPATPTLLVPGSPTSVVAVSVAINGSGQLAVTWLAPANTGGSAITDYLVKYSSNSGSTWANFVHPASTATSCTVTGLTNGSSYVIKVIAKNAVGSGLPSANSAPVTATSLAAALTPTFEATTSTATGFTVQISNWNPIYTWSGTATASGSVTVSGTGLVTVTGVAALTNSTATITTTRTGYVDGSAQVTATSLAAALTPAFWATTRTADGFTVQISNYDATYTWAGTATASGSVVVSGSGLVTVTGVALATSSAATITTTKANTVGGSATVTAISQDAALTPTFEATTSTATGFTVQISNYDSSYTWAGTATASGTVVVSGPGLVTVTGVAVATSSTATITTTKANTVGGSATVTATSLFFAMSMLTVGNAGNAADTGSDYPGYGAVSYTYQIGAYDVTGSQYTAFLNAVGSTDTYALYSNVNMIPDNGFGYAQISQSGTPGSFTYTVLNGTGQRPIAYVSWFDCARFSNWMSNGQPSGAQVSTTTENGAYNVNGATSGNAVAANAINPNTGLAPTYRMPLENEWYKAAYYSPNYGGSGIGGYYAYATQSDTAPGTTIGSSPNQANYRNAIAHGTDVGAFSGSGSYYGTFDQSGNIRQWNDLDGTAGSFRGTRGGVWNSDSYSVSSSGRGLDAPANKSCGFRLASPV